MAEETPPKRRSKVTSVSLNGYSLSRVTELVKSNQFNSVSDVISTALTEFLTAYDNQKVSVAKEFETMLPEMFSSFLQSDEGKKILSSMLECARVEGEPSNEKKVITNNVVIE